MPLVDKWDPVSTHKTRADAMKALRQTKYYRDYSRVRIRKTVNGWTIESYGGKGDPDRPLFRSKD